MAVAEMTIGDFIASARADRRLSLRAFAQYIGTSQTAVSDWEKGNRVPDPESCRKLARYLRQKRREPEWLFNGPKGRLTRSGVYWAVRGVFEELGYPRIIGPHDLRHTSATHAVGHMSEGAMMTLYGWSDSAMPRHYAKRGLLRAALEEHRRASPMQRLGR